MVNKIRSVNNVFNNTDLLRRKPPGAGRAQAESRQLAQCQHVGAWVDSACMSVHDSFVIDGQNSNRI